MDRGKAGGGMAWALFATVEALWERSKMRSMAYKALEARQAEPLRRLFATPGAVEVAAEAYRLDGEGGRHPMLEASVAQAMPELLHEFFEFGGMPLLARERKDALALACLLQVEDARTPAAGAGFQALAIDLFKAGADPLAVYGRGQFNCHVAMASDRQLFDPLSLAIGSKAGLAVEALVRMLGVAGSKFGQSGEDALRLGWECAHLCAQLRAGEPSFAASRALIGQALEMKRSEEPKASKRPKAFGIPSFGGRSGDPAAASRGSAAFF